MEQGSRRLKAVGVADMTDDTGAYRVYGLPPGDYYVAASLRVAPPDSIVETTYSPTYYPGTGSLAEAQRIKLGLGAEASASFPLLSLRSTRISGVVLSGSGSPANAFLNLVSEGSELGVPTGLAFGPGGRLYVGDRSGAVFTVTPDRQVETFATLPSSVAAFHLAFGPDACLYVTAPTLSTHDAVYRISGDRLVETVCTSFGRPQGLAFDSSGALYVVEALAGSAGLYRLDVSGEASAPELVVAAPSLVGVAFDPAGGLVLASSDTIWRIDNGLRPLARAA